MTEEFQITKGRKTKNHSFLFAGADESRITELQTGQIKPTNSQSDGVRKIYVKILNILILCFCKDMLPTVFSGKSEVSGGSSSTFWGCFSCIENLVLDHNTSYMGPKSSSVNIFHETEEKTQIFFSQRTPKCSSTSWLTVLNKVATESN